MPVSGAARPFSAAIQTAQIGRLSVVLSPRPSHPTGSRTYGLRICERPPFAWSGCPREDSRAMIRASRSPAHFRLVPRGLSVRERRMSLCANSATVNALDLHKGACPAMAWTIRRPAAILAADVAGYSRLIGADQEGTHERLQAHLREVVNPKIGEYRGRIITNTGDGFLVAFASVVDAVPCAVEVQRAMADRNKGTPPEHRIEFRIGINLT